MEVREPGAGVSLSRLLFDHGYTVICSLVYRTLTLKDARYGEVCHPLVCFSHAQRPGYSPSLGIQVLALH